MNVVSKRALIPILASVMVMVMVLILALAGCGGSDNSTDQAATTLVTVTRGNLSTTISAIGTVTMSNQADLTFGSGGSTSTVYTVNEVDESMSKRETQSKKGMYWLGWIRPP